MSTAMGEAGWHPSHRSQTELCVARSPPLQLRERMACALWGVGLAQIPKATRSGGPLLNAYLNGLGRLLKTSSCEFREVQRIFLSQKLYDRVPWVAA